MERWRIVKDYPNYMVSDLGNVKNINSGRILKPGINGPGYLIVGLHNKYGQKSLRVHILVAIAFLNHIPVGNYKIVVDHINNDKLDNRLENLQLINPRLNVTKDIRRNLPTGVYQRPNGRFVSKIYMNNTYNHLGTFDTIEEASIVYQEALKKGDSE